MDPTLDKFITQVKIKFKADGTLTVDTKQKLKDRRRGLHRKVSAWFRSLKLGRTPTQVDYCSTVDELHEIEGILEVDLDPILSQECDAIDQKLEQVYAKCKFDTDMPIGTANAAVTVQVRNEPEEVQEEVGQPEQVVPRGPQGDANRTVDRPSNQVIDDLITFEFQREPIGQESQSNTIVDESDFAPLSLRDIPMPKFDNDVTKWLTFWPKYNALVHSNTKVGYIEKGVRLEQCLYGPAQSWIKELIPTKQSYCQVITNMRTYFENPQVQKAAFNVHLSHLKRIDNRYDVSSLRNLWSSASITLTQAKQLQLPDIYINQDVLTTIKKVLPEEYQYAINQKRPKVATLEEFISELLVQIECTEQFIADNGVPRSVPNTGGRYGLQRTYKPQEQVISNSQVPNSYPIGQAAQQPITPTEQPYQNYVEFTNVNQATTHFTTYKMCSFCDDRTHVTSQCILDQFAREAAARSKNLCLACLQPGHVWSECTNTKLNCRKCNGGKHWAYMCATIQRLKQQQFTEQHEQHPVNVRSISTQPMLPRPTTSNDLSSHPSATSSEVVNSETVVRKCNLGTAQYQTCIARINNREVRIAFDSAAGHSFITEKLATELNLEVSKAPELGIKRHAESEVSSINDRITSFMLSSLTNDFTIKTNVRVVDDLGDMRWKSLSKDKVIELKSQGIHYQDDESRPIEIIFGLPYYSRVVTGQEVKVDDDLIAKQTKIGWLVFGGKEERVQPAIPNGTDKPDCKPTWCGRPRVEGFLQKDRLIDFNDIDNHKESETASQDNNQMKQDPIELVNTHQCQVEQNESHDLEKRLDIWMVSLNNLTQELDNILLSESKASVTLLLSKYKSQIQTQVTHLQNRMEQYLHEQSQAVFTTHKDQCQMPTSNESLQTCKPSNELTDQLANRMDNTGSPSTHHRHTRFKEWPVNLYWHEECINLVHYDSRQLSLYLHIRFKLMQSTYTNSLSDKRLDLQIEDGPPLKISPEELVHWEETHIALSDDKAVPARAQDVANATKQVEFDRTIAFPGPI